MYVCIIHRRVHVETSENETTKFHMYLNTKHVEGDWTKDEEKLEEQKQNKHI